MLGEVDLAAQHVMVEVGAITYMVCITHLFTSIFMHMLSLNSNLAFWEMHLFTLDKEINQSHGSMLSKGRRFRGNLV